MYCGRKEEKRKRRKEEKEGKKAGSIEDSVQNVKDKGGNEGKKKVGGEEENILGKFLTGNETVPHLA